MLATVRIMYNSIKKEWTSNMPNNISECRIFERMWFKWNEKFAEKFLKINSLKYKLKSKISWD